MLTPVPRLRVLDAQGRINDTALSDVGVFRCTSVRRSAEFFHWFHPDPCNHDHLPGLHHCKPSALDPKASLLSGYFNAPPCSLLQLTSATSSQKAAAQSCMLRSPCAPARRTAVLVQAAAASAASSSDAAPASNQWKVPTYIFAWYATNMIFNILNKTTLNNFPCPWFIATLQLGAHLMTSWLQRYLCSHLSCSGLVF